MKKKTKKTMKELLGLVDTKKLGVAAFPKKMIKKKKTKKK